MLPHPTRRQEDPGDLLHALQVLSPPVRPVEGSRRQLRLLYLKAIGVGVTIRTRDSSKLIRIPVKRPAGLVPRSRDRDTFSTVSTSDSPGMLKVPLSGIWEVRVVAAAKALIRYVVLPRSESNHPRRVVMLQVNFPARQ